MSLAALLLALPVSVPSERCVPGAPGAPGADVAIEWHVAPVVELWFEVRALAASDDEPQGELAGAVAAARAALDALGSERAFGLLEGRLEDCQDVDDLAAAFGSLPRRFTLRTARGPREIDLHETGARLVAALRPLEEAWTRETWPARKRELDARRDQLQVFFERGEARAWSRLCELFELESGPQTVPIWLVTRAPAPGGFTHRARKLGAASFIALRSAAERGLSELAEIALHEGLHALEVRHPRDTLFHALHAALEAAGRAPGDPAARNAVHALFFAAASAVVQAELDPGHVPYGESSGLYDRAGPEAARVRALWKRYAAGELARAAFLDAFVEASD